MGGVKALQTIQWGYETTAGTAVAATKIWRGPGSGIVALDEIEFVEEDVARFFGSNRTVKRSQGAEIVIPETAFTFEQFAVLCQSGVEYQQTGVTDTGASASGKIYTFDFSLASINAIKTLTIEAGDNIDADEMEYAFCREFTVSGAPGELVKMGASFQGRKRADTTLTGALSLDTINCAPFNMATLYADTAGGTMGGTAITGAFLGMTIKVNTGIKPVKTADGQLYFYSHEIVDPEMTADIIFRHLAGADSEDDNWLGQTARLLEIKLTGPALSTAGTYTYYTARFQMPGKWSKFTELKDSNGMTILTGTFKAQYDLTAAAGPKIVVVNQVATYP